MATGREILSYGGDANLALGRGAGLSVFGVPDLTPITQTARDVALYSFAANQIKHRQRIADRDAAFKMLDDDALVLDNILEQDRPIVEAQTKKIEEIWDKYSGDIMSDPKKFREFKGQIAAAKTHINQAHKRYLGVQGDLAARSKEARNPVDQQNFDKNIATQVGKGFWDTYTPYVPVTHFDLKVVAAPPVYGAAENLAEGEYDVTRQKVDPESTFNLYQRNWADPEQTHTFNEYVGRFLTGPNAAKDVARINDSLAKVNAQLGLQPGDKNYVAPLGVKPDPQSNGVAFIADQDRVDQIAAKIALADNDAILSKKEFAAQRARVNVDREQLKENARQANMQNALGWARLHNDKEELGLRREQWKATQKGGETVRNGAWEFANRIYKELTSLADEYGVISPDNMRKLTVEQKRYLGIEQSEDGKTPTLKPLETTDKDVIQLDNGKIKYLTGATFNPQTKKYGGTWNPEKTTTLYNIATNRLNEENQKSGSKELNSYVPIDTGEGGVSSNTSGGSSSQSGSSSTKKLTGTESPASLVPGEVYELDGQKYKWNGKNLIAQ